jgi:hypothetical protein
MKPYRGIIENWERRLVDKNAVPEVPNLGFVIEGRPLGHPIFWKSNRIRTSIVVAFNENTMQIETLNSVYDLRNPKR